MDNDIAKYLYDKYGGKYTATTEFIRTLPINDFIQLCIELIKRGEYEEANLLMSVTILPPLIAGCNSIDESLQKLDSLHNYTKQKIINIDKEFNTQKK